jgi:large subunit ribosomal protein L23
MELNIYDIIKSIISTPKSLDLRKKYGKITFEVNKFANKVMIRNAVESIWSVKIRDVRVLNRTGKNRIVKKKSFKMSDTKKAIITLKPGFKIDLPDQFESVGLSSSGVVSKKEVGK